MGKLLDNSIMVYQWMDGIVTSNVEDIVEILGIRKHTYIQTLLKEFDGNLSFWQEYSHLFRWEMNCLYFY